MSDDQLDYEANRIYNNPSEQFNGMSAKQALMFKAYSLYTGTTKRDLIIEYLLTHQLSRPLTHSLTGMIGF